VRSTIDGRRLSLSALSAGEQQEMLMLHKLLFDTPRGTVVLLDEPEISLHVEWQEQFIRDLVSICALGEFDAIVATHSPVLVGDFWCLTTSLSEQAGSIEDLLAGYEEIVEYGTWGGLSSEEESLHEEGDVPF
jgi:predicted ATP-binding protein involved in virulence